jgi:hypothetical protein
MGGPSKTSVWFVFLLIRFMGLDQVKCVASFPPKYRVASAEWIGLPEGSHWPRIADVCCCGTEERWAFCERLTAVLLAYVYR